MNRLRTLLLCSLTAVLSLLLSSSAQEQAHFALYGGGSYRPTDTIQLQYFFTNPSKTPLAIYRVKNPHALLEHGGPQSFSGTEDLDLAHVRTLSLEGGQGRYDRLELGTLPEGIYFVQLGTGPASSATLLVVTDLSLVAKTDRDSVLVYTARTSDGEPRTSEVFLLAEQVIQVQADTQGLAIFDNLSSEHNRVVAARDGNAWAFSSAYWHSGGVYRTRVYLQTDRPVYRPGHTVFYKGTARTFADTAPLAEHEVAVTIRDARGAEILTQNLVTDAYGTFHAELLLDEEPPLGRYTIQVTLLGETNWTSFDVQEFQKPEHRVTVNTPEAVAVQGDPLSFTLAAEYLFGGPVAGGTVNYTVMKQPLYRQWYSSPYSFYQETSYPYSYYNSEILHEGQGTLDASGQLVVAYTPPADAHEYRLIVQANVTDESRRETSGRGTVDVYPSSIVLNVTTERYAYQTDEAVTVTVRATDLSGKPVSVPLDLYFTRYFWHENHGSDRITTRAHQGETNEAGVATFTLTLEEQGSYDLTVSARDSQDRESTANRHIWVSGDTRWYWAYSQLNIETDKPEYHVGDTARLVIQSPVPDAYALVTHEGQALTSHELIRIDGSILTYELPITEQMSPNTFVSVSIIGNGGIYTNSTSVHVPPVDKFLQIDITSDAQTYQPQDTVNFEVQITDADGNGVQAQLTLGLVDEGIYLIRPDQTPDIRGFYHALRSNAVGTQTSAWYYFGRAEALPSAAAPFALDEAEVAERTSPHAEATVREDFRDTILWLPTLETDPQGHASVSVTLPDNLTEWRLTARAITLGDQVGQDTHHITTTLPVIARLAAPRFLIRDDNASLRVIAQSNLNEAQEGRLELIVEGLELTRGTPRELTLEPGARATADFDVHAAQTGEALLTASALTPVFSDAMRVPLPVLPRGIRQAVGWADSGSSTWRFTLPPDVTLDSARGTLYLTPSLAAAVSPALAYLAGYPYGCTEQTMSRFLPSVLAAHAGDLAQLPDEVADNLDDIVNTGLKRLYDFQHDNGGWGFWQQGETSPFITAYVISGLLDAQDAGYTVKKSVLERGLAYLESFINSEGFSGHRLVEADGKAYAYYTLARAGRSLDGLEAIIATKAMSPYGLALSVLALHEAARDTEAKLYLDELLSRVTESDQAAYWQTGAPRYYWNDDQVEATAYALHALVTLRPDHALVPKVVNWLLLQRRGAHWVSTKDTAAVIKASLALAHATGESTLDYQVRVRMNGQELFTAHLQGQTSDSFTVSLANFRPRNNMLELDIDGAGTLYASAAVTFVAEQEDPQPTSTGLKITRTYEALQSTYLKEENRYGYERTPFSSTSTVGDYLLVTVTLEPQGQYRYVIVNDPLPAGYRVIEEDQAFRIAGLEPRYGYGYYGWNYWYDGRDIRDERVDYYFTHLSSPVTFTYILRAETPGSFTALPTQAWLMYEPDVRGTGLLTVLNVEQEQ